MNNIEVKNGILFVDGIKVSLKKGEVDEELLYGTVGNESIIIRRGTFYRGNGVMNAKFIGVISYDSFLELKANAK